MKTVFIEVDEHDALPDGCFMKFSALGEAYPIDRVRYELPDGTQALCLVEGRGEEDERESAWAVLVDDSSAGQSLLIGGGKHGLRIRPEAGGEAWAEAYLLLSPDADMKGA